MNHADVRLLMKAIAPILKQFVGESLEPIERRLDALEAAQSGKVKHLPRVRVPARSRAA